MVWLGGGGVGVNAADESSERAARVLVDMVRVAACRVDREVVPVHTNGQTHNGADKSVSRTTAGRRTSEGSTSYKATVSAVRLNTLALGQSD